MFSKYQHQLLFRLIALYLLYDKNENTYNLDNILNPTSDGLFEDEEKVKTQSDQRTEVYPEDRMIDYLTYLNEKTEKFKNATKEPSVERLKYINDIVSIINIEKENGNYIIKIPSTVIRDPLNARRSFDVNKVNILI